LLFNYDPAVKCEHARYFIIAQWDRIHQKEPLLQIREAQIWEAAAKTKIDHLLQRKMAYFNIRIYCCSFWP
jgi:hypothetical protein